MRIGIDIRELEEGKKTGIGRFLLNFLKSIGISDTENSYILFGNQNTCKPNLIGNVTLKIIPSFLKIYWDQVVLSQQIYKEKIDIFFSPSYTAPLLCKTKFIVTCHDLYFLNSDNNPFTNWLRRYYCYLIWEKASRIIAVSEYSKKEVMKFLGCSDELVSIVYDSVEEKFRPIDKTESLKRLNKFKEITKDFILYVGNLKLHKNLIRLIEAYNLMPQQLKENFQLVIVGKKDENYPSLSHLIKKFNLSNNIVFLDVVSDEDLVFLYNASYVLVLVSLHEGFGLPALEAMACGVAVIVSDMTSLPEVVGNAGLYVNPYDINNISYNLQRLLADDSLRKELSKNAIEQAKRFKVEYSTNKILEIFKDVVDIK